MDTLRFYIRSLALPLGELSSKVTERAVTVGDRERQGNKFRFVDLPVSPMGIHSNPQ